MSDPDASWLSIDGVVAPSDSAAAECEADITSIAGVMFHLFREIAGIDPPPVRIKVVPDLISAVSQILDPEGLEDSWSNERLGGQVAAKNLVDPKREGGILILFDSELTFLENEDLVGNPRLNRIFLIAHELVHPTLSRIRDESKVLKGVSFPSKTARELARSMTRIAVDEFRADVIAGIVLGRMASVSESADSAPEPATVSQTFAINHLASTEDVISGLFPSLPDLVDSYRHGDIDLESMWWNVVRQTDQLLTQLAHCEALCTLLQIPDLLELENIAGLRGTEIFVDGLWRPIAQTLREAPTLPSPAELAETEPNILGVGEDSVFAFWRRLGLHPTETSAGQDYLKVTAPSR